MMENQETFPIKYRIFDKENCEYLEEPDYMWLLSREGDLYNTENDEWHTIGERFIVEFLVFKTDREVSVFIGDIVDYCGSVGFVLCNDFISNVLVFFPQNCLYMSLDSFDDVNDIKTIGNMNEHKHLIDAVNPFKK